jgi:hypothetical protein
MPDLKKYVDAVNATTPLINTLQYLDAHCTCGHHIQDAFIPSYLSGYTVTPFHSKSGGVTVCMEMQMNY